MRYWYLLIYQKILNKVNATQKNAKTYWSITKMLLNIQKIPHISPLYYQISKTKVNFLTRFSSENAPSFTIIVHVLVTLNYWKTQSAVALSVEDIGEMIHNFDSNKGYGHII